MGSSRGGRRGQEPAAGQAVQLRDYGTIVLETTLPDGQKKQEKIQDAGRGEADERDHSRHALRKRVVYFLKGHGEKDLSSSERTGYGQMKSAIEKLNYDVKDLLLAREPKVPDDATIVVVAGPQKELLPTEIEALVGYVARAGKIFMIDPFQDAAGLGRPSSGGGSASGTT